MSLILFAIPAFFALILLELAIDSRRKTGFYRVNDSINSLTIGVYSRIAGLARAAIPLSFYPLVLDALAIYEVSATWYWWVIAFVLYDFCYYWNHRFGHEISFFWASHVVHHSSEEYNLTTALRQTSTSLLGWIFYLPLALLGIPVEMLITVGALNLIYQFWVHTRHIPKLGWYEWLFVTPSNHRVHHAQNQCYIDKNYGGVFILWDRLFGTFQEELDDEPPLYGIRKALSSWNPLWANVHVYSQLAKDSWHTARWGDKWRVWFGRTGWRPEDVSQSHPIAKADLSRFKKFDIPLSIHERLYATLQHIGILLITLVFLLNVSALTPIMKWSVAGFIFVSGMTLAAFMENRVWAHVTEWIRQLAMLGVIISGALPTWLTTSLLVIIAISLPMLWQSKRTSTLILE